MPDSPVRINKSDYRAAFGDFDGTAKNDLYWPDEASVRRRRLIYAILGVTAVFFVAGAVSAVLISVQQPRTAPDINARSASTGVPVPPKETADTAPDGPLAKVPEGMTVIPKKQAATQVPVAAEPVPAAVQTTEEADPVAAPAATQQLGYGIELGAARSFGELSRRFAEIADANQEAAFDQLEPRATLADTPDGLEARLLVGPFATLDDAESTCGQLALPAGISCRPVGFAGEVIARQ
jgi:hypothetical protein